MRGLCMCGCGKATTVATKTDRHAGQVKGEPVKYISGHNKRNERREQSSNWRGGRTLHQGYVRIRIDGEYVFEHVWLASRALGRPLPSDAQVHHINGDKADNRPNNLVLCNDVAYHLLLHRRQRALAACGNATWRKCYFCKQYDDPSALVICKGGSSAYHRACNIETLRARRAAHVHS